MLPAGITTYEGVYNLLYLVDTDESLRDFNRRALRNPAGTTGIIEFCHGPENYSMPFQYRSPSPVLELNSISPDLWVLVPFCCPDDFLENDKRMQDIFGRGFDVLRQYIERCVMTLPDESVVV